MKNVLFLSLEDVVTCLNKHTIPSLCERIETGFHYFNQGAIEQPHKIVMQDRASFSSHINIMPCIVNDEDSNENIYSVKIIGSEVENVTRGLPRATGLIVLFDKHTKIPVCIMDVQAVSAMRTGLISRLAAKYIVPQQVEHVTLIGAGVNMRTQVTAMQDILSQAKKITVYSRGESKYQFAEEMSEKLNLKIQAVDSHIDCLPMSDLIIDCTSSHGDPWISNKLIKEKNVTLFDIGGIDLETAIIGQMDKVIVDDWDSVKSRGLFPVTMAYQENLIKDDDVINLTDIIAGRKKGRENTQEKIYFSPVGMAFYDAMVAPLIYKAAMQDAVGQEVNLWQNHCWI